VLFDLTKQFDLRIRQLIGHFVPSGSGLSRREYLAEHYFPSAFSISRRIASGRESSDDELLVTPQTCRTCHVRLEEVCAPTPLSGGLSFAHARRLVSSHALAADGANLSRPIPAEDSAFPPLSNTIAGINSVKVFCAHRVAAKMNLRRT
jgi:hypothetical protein